jgi:hypothetical protein
VVVVVDGSDFSDNLLNVDSNLSATDGLHGR